MLIYKLVRCEIPFFKYLASKMHNVWYQKAYEYISVAEFPRKYSLENRTVTMRNLLEEPTFWYEVYRSAICVSPTEIVAKREVCLLQVNAIIDKPFSNKKSSRPAMLNFNIMSFSPSYVYSIIKNVLLAIGKNNELMKSWSQKLALCHCVEDVLIRSYSGPHFPAFGLNT